jgi:23S rRNA (guanosine2251-2'-O)-methyltransferase
VVAVVSGAAAAHSLDDVLEGLQEPALLLVLDGVTDPHNLGACLRSADAFGAQAVIVPKDRAVGVNATVAKVASGAADTVPVVSVTNLARSLQELKERGVWIAGADASAEESIFEADLSGPLAWVLGAEGTGLRRLTRERCDRLLRIPLQGSVASLNVSVAAGVCLFATRQQRMYPPRRSGVSS